MAFARILLLFSYVYAAWGALAPTVTLNDGNKMPMLALGTGRGTAPQNESLDSVRQAVFWALEAGYRHIDTAAVYGDESQVGQGIADAIAQGLNESLDSVRQAVFWALEAGYRHIDTAAVYGDESQVGQGIADAIAQGLVKREDIFVTTKLWNDHHEHDEVVPALKESLERLKLDYVDLYLIHFPVATESDGTLEDVDYVETWRGMEYAWRKNLARSIGVSNFNDSQIDRLYRHADVKPAVNQVEINPTMTQEPLVSHCQHLGTQLMAYSPLGFLVSRNKKDAPPPAIDDPVLVAMANKYGKTTGQIVLRYLVERGLTPIPKSTDKGRIQQNLDIFDFALSKDEVALISKFNKNKRVIYPAQWKDSPYFPFE